MCNAFFLSSFLYTVEKLFTKYTVYLNIMNEYIHTYSINVYLYLYRASILVGTFQVSLGNSSSSPWLRIPMRFTAPVTFTLHRRMEYNAWQTRKALFFLFVYIFMGSFSCVYVIYFVCMIFWLLVSCRIKSKIHQDQEKCVGIESFFFPSHLTRYV